MSALSWYDSSEKLARLEAVAASWLGTPFRENSAVKGPGGAVCCHFLAAAIFSETGFFPADFRPPRGFVSQLKSGAPEAIIAWVDANMPEKFAKIEIPSGSADPTALNVRLDALTLPGDLITLRDDHDVQKHFGNVLPARRFIHVLRGIGVRISHLHDATYAPRIAEIRRPQP